MCTWSLPGGRANLVRSTWYDNVEPCQMPRPKMPTRNGYITSKRDVLQRKSGWDC